MPRYGLGLADNASGTVCHEFASFTIDVSSLVGNLWNSSAKFPFADAIVRNLTRALAPAVLRVGGTAADQVFYNVAPGAAQHYASYGQPLNASVLGDLFGFARDLGLTVAFGLNGGHGPRAADGTAAAPGSNAPAAPAPRLP